jgi:exodeoxyribonuclease VII small subunit
VTQAPDPPPRAPSFEEALAGLEAIVERLETGELPLESALAAFEEGVALSRRCAEQLEHAEQRIAELVREGGVLIARPQGPAEGDA